MDITNEQFEKTRNLFRHYLLLLFKKYDIVDSDIYAYKFENEIYTKYDIFIYLKFIPIICKILNVQIATLYSNNGLKISYITNSIFLSDERIIMVKNIEKLLTTGLLSYKNDTILSLKTAKKIEKSCYNSVINTCKKSTIQIRRNWDNPIFKQIYSNKCGSICVVLDKDSPTFIKFGPVVLTDIFNNVIDINKIGTISIKKLLPQSIKSEQDEINIRSEQRVIEKESNLFKCPSCKERRVSYREVQLRSIDEAPDYLCKCINCGHNFKGSC